MGPDHGESMRIKEIREGRATYYIVPFEFLDESIDFSNLTFSPREQRLYSSTKSKCSSGARTRKQCRKTCQG